MTLMLDSATPWELVNQRGLWEDSELYRIGVAVTAIGGAASVEEAHELVWQALNGVGAQEPARDALALVGLDVPAIEAHLRLLDAEYVRRRGDRIERLYSDGHRTARRAGQAPLRGESAGRELHP